MPRHAIDVSRRWQAGPYPPACLDLGGPAPGSCRRLLPVPGSPPMQGCFPRAIRPCQSHSTFSGLISTRRLASHTGPSLIFWWNVPVNGILTSLERVVLSPCLFDSYLLERKLRRYKITRMAPTLVAAIPLIAGGARPVLRPPVVGTRFRVKKLTLDHTFTWGRLLMSALTTGAIAIGSQPQSPERR